ncbi:MAG TPA: LacI family DNA-binding transcriptional regulator, partial [Ktedonobacteraceae bacterium]
SMQTVSRVIRTPHLVAPETVTLVRAAMEELGYVRNEQATALRLGRARTIGLLLPLLARPFWSEFVAGAEIRAHEQGYSLLLCDTSDLASEEECIALLLGYQVAGIIYVPLHKHTKTHPARAMLIQSGTPTVVASVYTDDLHDYVRTDDRRAGYVIACHLLDLGHRRIVVVTEKGELLYERIQGVYDALRDAGIDGEISCVFLASNAYEGGFAAGQTILENGKPLPDAIFVTTDMMALGLLEALRSSGIRIPEDIAVASHDGLHASAFVTPPLTTVAPRAREMGKTSVDTLLRIPVEKSPPSVHMIEADLLVRASTIGAERAALHTFSTPISAPDAWSCWRTQPAPTQRKGTEVVQLTFEQVLHNREEGGSFSEI